MTHETGRGRYTDYDPFAWIYERDWGADYHEQAIDVLDRAFLTELPPPARVLDLCCGTGRLTQVMAARGYRMSGLDGSREMLEYARQRAPEVDFVLADARDFRLDAEFDAVISTFDSLNHVPDGAGLEQVFRNVLGCLRPDGYFVFDLNEEAAYTNVWIWPLTNVEPDRAFIARGTYDKESRLARCDVTVFRLVDGAWQRADFCLSQTYHPAPEVFRRLAAAGFVEVQRMDAQRDLGMHGGIGYARSYYLARKPGAATSAISKFYP